MLLYRSCSLPNDDVVLDYYIGTAPCQTLQSLCQTFRKHLLVASGSEVGNMPPRPNTHEHLQTRVTQLERLVHQLEGVVQQLQNEVPKF